MIRLFATITRPKFGLSDSDVPATGKPLRFHINEVDDVFIATADDVD